MRVLALESSCDETSAAVVRREGDRATLDGLAILSQDIHRIFGGVVPELASRAHLETVGPVVDEALRQAGIGLDAIDGIAVTHGPGLLGALLVGVTWGKTLAWREGLPLIGVHHMEGHLFAPTLEDPTVAPPFTALLVSGGHTMLLDVPAWGDYRLLGATKDDAAGEAFDKVGTLLGLDYPAGAAIEKLAATGDPKRFTFPRPLLKGIRDDDRWNFSFSGLKTALLRAVQQCEDLEAERSNLARGFQDAVIEVLVAKTLDAADVHRRELVVVGWWGGLQPDPSGQDARRRTGRRAGGRRLAATQHRQCRDDRRRRQLAARLRRATRPDPRGERRPAAPRPRHFLRSVGVTIAHPLVINLGFITITGFGLTMMLAFLIGAWIVDQELRRHGFAPDFAGDMVLGAVIGGIVGAKLWYVALHGVQALFSREGLVFYGGFVGGALGVMLNVWRRRVPIRWAMQLVAPSLAAAYAIGRVGCFVVGDDYGRPTSLPWAVAFPQGAPPSTAGIMAAEFGTRVPAGTPPDTLLAVHPTQLYEIAIMLVVFAILWAWRRKERGTGWLFGAYLVLAGAERFFVEIFRAKDDRFLAGMTIAQATAMVSVVVGIALWAGLSGAKPVEPGAWLTKGSGTDK